MSMTCHTGDTAEMDKSDMCEFGGQVLGTMRLTSLKFFRKSNFFRT